MGLMQRYEHLLQELLVLLLEWDGETVYDAAQYFKQLGNAIELLMLINEPQEYVVYLLADVGAQTQEFAINTMQYGL